MKISRDDLNYEVDTDEQIKTANKKLDEIEFSDKFDDSKLNQMILDYKAFRTDKMKAQIIRYVLILILKMGGKKIMNKFLIEALKALMKTDLDDKLYEILADKAKEEIPGTEYEPIIGEVLIKIGEELKKE